MNISLELASKVQKMLKNKETWYYKWFISNRTLKNTDLSADGDGLAKQSCTGGNLWNLWNHGMYLCMNFKSCNFSLSIVLFIQIKDQNTRS